MQVVNADLSLAEVERMMGRVRDASGYLKFLGHEGRLIILCLLTTGEKAVGELEVLTSIRQTTMSQHLARLRQEGLVSARREGRSVYYSLANENANRVLESLYDISCGRN